MDFKTQVRLHIVIIRVNGIFQQGRLSKLGEPPTPPTHIYRYVSKTTPEMNLKR
jgi:hypothetical protein